MDCVYYYYIGRTLNLVTRLGEHDGGNGCAALAGKVFDKTSSIFILADLSAMESLLKSMEAFLTPSSMEMILAVAETRLIQAMKNGSLICAHLGQPGAECCVPWIWRSHGPFFGTRCQRSF